MSALRSFWAGLSPRDRRMLIGGGIALAIILAWLMIWEPLREARDAARIRVAAASTDLATMRAAAPQLRALAGSGQEGSRDTRSLLALVDATARASGVGEALLRVEPISGDQVRVYFEGAGFDALVVWLEELESRQGVSLGDVSINRAAGVGRVDARLSLQRGGG
ncbi:type II secretion system protein M [Xanthomonadaceae bacterium JHOS43]|nr:type II secretion system protein M [Xanthomonadaceae bacterium JHOS43]MCX7562947.1 type II secretion system protein M [Xanthomonadaceae bacterium XH05]